jgi:hypothetical protein
MPVATLLTLSSKKILSFRLIPQLCVFFDGSVEQFAYDNKEEKEAISPRRCPKNKTDCPLLASLF